MRRRRSQEADADQHDRGAGLVEVLVAVVLLGLGATGTLTAIATAIKGSTQAREGTAARRWVVSAADYLVSSNVARVPCTSGEASVRSSYETSLRAQAVGRPNGWADTQLTIVSPVLFWQGSSFGTTCGEANRLYLQEITIRVVSPDGKQIETITVVKGNV